MNLKNHVGVGGLLLAVAPTPAAAAEGWEALFAVDWGLSFWTVATFCSLLFVLTKFAWKPLLGALDAREQKIQAMIDDAKRLKSESETLAEEHRLQLAEARREAQKIVADSRDAAERVRKEIEEKARAEGQSLLERARREIEQEKDSAIDSLRRESVEIALAAASKLIDKNLDSTADRALVTDYLDALTRDGGARA